MLDSNLQITPQQRARGKAEIVFGPTGLRHLYQSGCAKILLPKTHTRQSEAVLINTSGGITGGDILHWSGRVEPDACLTMTSQTAERIYRASSDVAQVVNDLNLSENSRLDWLPQETILFDESALKRQLKVTMAQSAQLLAVETLVFGRKAMGEEITDLTLEDHWRIKRGGALIYADNFRLQGPMCQVLQSPTILGANRALATLVYVAPDAEARLDQARSLLVGAEIEAAASAWNGMLILRFLAPDAQPLRVALISFLTRFRGVDLPRVWTM